jgi:hypothetical protein
MQKTDEQRRRDHAHLMEAQKSVRKRIDGGNNRRPAALQHFVDHRAQPEEKGYVAHNAYGKTHQYYPIIAIEDYRKGFMNTAIDNYFNSSYKNMVSFLPKRRNISQRASRNSGHDRKSERRKIDFYQN